MPVISLATVRQAQAETAESALRRRSDLGLGEQLLAADAVHPEALERSLAKQARMDVSLGEFLIAEGETSAEAVAEAQGRHYGTGRADFAAYPPDPRLIDVLGAQICLRLGLLPWRRFAGATLIATSRPDRFEQLAATLPAELNPAIMVICREDELQHAIAGCRAEVLIRAAETRVPEAESCRFWLRSGPRAALVAALAALVLLAALAPISVLTVLTLWTVGWMIAGSLVKAAAAVTQALALHRARRAPPHPVATIARLPRISILVPLFRESEIGPRLIARLSRLDYPRALLDICLVTEAGDAETRAMLDATRLPSWMRRVAVPDGALKTKPRALNYALDFCHGSIVGIYDAEDAPAPDQLRRVVEHFHRCAPDVAVLQGVLDFYNARANWLARCFAIEYAAWFRVVLPGLARLGVPVPLGGTTLFFRRRVLEDLGGWDAHNVTEDADLGLRLARHGYRTEFLDSVTEEEANCRAWPWVRQRSRWLKGYAMTWATHMRRPDRLLRQFGPWGFFGMQVLFLGTLTQFTFMPLIWSFWALPLGLGHPLAQVIPADGFTALFVLFIGSELVTLGVGAMGLSRAGKRGLIPWLPTLHLYFPLAALASYKAVWEIAARPFYWDKTRHGLGEPDGGETAAAAAARARVTAAIARAGAIDATAPAPQPPAINASASWRSRVSNAIEM
ncbi:glycosyltransferase family 2 protein [Rhodovulum euryhalinum]|uniref:Cellulose synthase/poly-beta-1,6-N-acetylglucosamine synthase-like glycosyltransferase n=1 Tax=Rhodovulum euryhalinum TaxID=35805 RepID=A0A4V2SAT4_9RHOB|nr:glycosyltransferase family 2 protein [Rhodovulum euryhalinum]TCO72860.1 cellulose synthase/poly-beta-1,6-N-acetylglucosamine synthase-like glycosyltransferase [Rhodovulum euryhalinum]